MTEAKRINTTDSVNLATKTCGAGFYFSITADNHDDFVRKLADAYACFCQPAATVAA